MAAFPQWTVGDLRKHIAGLPDDRLLSVVSGLTATHEQALPVVLAVERNGTLFFVMGSRTAVPDPDPVIDAFSGRRESDRQRDLCACGHERSVHAPDTGPCCLGTCACAIWRPPAILRSHGM